jgi:hypothetical protein
MFYSKYSIKKCTTLTMGKLKEKLPTRGRSLTCQSNSLMSMKLKYALP